MRRLVYVGLILFSLMLAEKANAVVVIGNATSCIGCSSSQMYSIASNKITQNSSINSWYVYDYSRNILRKYNRGNIAIWGINSPTEVLPEADLSDYVGHMSYIYSVTNGSMYINAQISLPLTSASSTNGDASQLNYSVQKMQITLPASDDYWVREQIPAGTFSACKTPYSIYDVVKDNPARTCVLNYVSDFNNWPQTSIELFHLQAAYQIGKIIGGGQVTVQFQVNFPDGGRMDVIYNSVTQTCSYVPGSAYDSHGNHIPENKSDVAGREFDFSGPGNINDRFRMGQILNGWGLGGSGGAGVGGGAHGWACVATGDGENKVYTCTAY